jgi:hypothetical protein
MAQIGAERPKAGAAEDFLKTENRLDILGMSLMSSRTDRD